MQPHESQPIARQASQPIATLCPKPRKKPRNWLHDVSQWAAPEFGKGSTGSSSVVFLSKNQQGASAVFEKRYRWGLVVVADRCGRLRLTGPATFDGDREAAS